MMKYICLGYSDEKTWETMSENQRNAMIDACFTYDDILRKNGHLMSRHPGVKAGAFEIRPAEDLTEMIRDSARRRSITQDE
jgi:hypothetical protein